MILFDNMQFNMLFTPINNMRSKFSQIEQNINYGFNTPFEILPIPDNAPLEIPRMIGRSFNNHSNVQISANNLQLNIIFDNNFNSDFNKCFDYVEEKIKCLDNAIRNVSDNILFMGLVVQLIDDEQKNPQEFIKCRLFNIETQQSIFDIFGKVTIVKDDEFYINLSLSNLRKINTKEQALGIILDINDRYRYNFKPNTFSDSNNINTILDLHRKITTEKIENFLEKGEFNL